MWKYIAGTVIFGSAAAYAVRRYFCGASCKCTARLDGLVVVVTGANSGIGKATALLLAQKGATLVLACRNIQEGIETKKYIHSKFTAKKTKIYVKNLDLASFTSIRKFAESLNSEFSEIYALVNNAGVFFIPTEQTADDFEITLQTNYFGPFVLTHLLIPLLKKSDHARIINVSSEAHKTVDADTLLNITLDPGRAKSRFTLYSVSKLGVNMMTVYMAKMLTESNIIVNSVDPGNTETSIFRHFPALSNPWAFMLQWPIRIIIIKRPSEGAQTVLHAILTENRSTGQYYKDCNLAPANPVTMDDRVVKKYYELTMVMVKRYIDDESDC